MNTFLQTTKENLLLTVLCAVGLCAESLLAQDMTPPSLVSSSPANGATGVALDAKVIFTFSEEMQASQSIFWNASGSGFDSGKFSYSWSVDQKTLTCAYADSVPKITAEVVEAAAKELQWPPHSERIEKRRLNMKRGAVEGGVQGILREQSQTLGAIAAFVSKLEERSPALESIGKSLAAIEAHLRNLVQNRSLQSRQDSTADRQQKSG